MKRDKYLCQNCRRDGIATKASSVDHIIPKAHGGTDDDFNLESLCWTCHSKENSNRENPMKSFKLNTLMAF
ncbi:HNH endonuclease domain protein [Klebsiella pneumoniae]|uniref:Putative HNH nuclease YajD n=1 Tax=Klebsiella pneumoniae TaxID=573 RepID=A0A4P0XYN6_KLEPN|nr:HNH endonuclease domain protein [Klebsiella pneumoniae]